MMQQTNVVVTFQFATDRESELVTLLQLIVTLALMLWTVGRVIYSAGYNLATLVADLLEAIVFVARVYQIAFISIKWSLGL